MEIIQASLPAHVSSRNDANDERAVQNCKSASLKESIDLT